MIKSILCLVIAILLPTQVIAIDSDSVYKWGAWAKGIKPAAGALNSVTPQPAIKPDINFRPNENMAFFREAIQQPNIVTGFGNINTSLPVITSPPPLSTSPPPPPTPN